MMSEEFLLKNGATVKKYPKNQSIFFEGDMAMYYHQIVKGSVKMVSVNETGKEFIQGIFKSGDSFGEPLLIIDDPYPATAVANEDSVIIRLPKDAFLQVLKDNFDIHFQFSKVLAKRIYNKSLIATEISTYGPEHRILSILKIFKKNNGSLAEQPYKVELSRQQIADMTGLRVETVIRSIKKLEEKGMISIQKGKIYL